jgi:hypothetical protein
MRCVVLSFIAEPMVEGAAPLQLQGKMGRIWYRQGSNFSAQREIARRVEGPAITGGVRMTGACDFRWRVQECAAGPTDGDGRDLRYRRDGGVGDRLPHVSRSIPFESPVQDAPRAPLNLILHRSESCASVRVSSLVPIRCRKIRGAGRANSSTCPMAVAPITSQICETSI